MGVTIRDIAREAGVSTATVSRVLNSSGSVTEDTRRKVERAVRALNYRGCRAAPHLVAGPSRTVGVILPVLYGDFFSKVFQGIDLRLRRGSNHLLVSNAHAAPRELEVALHAIAGKVDGLLIMAPDIDAEVLEATLPPRLPITLMNSRLHTAQRDALCIDNYRGAYLMVQHLLMHGHERLALIKGREGNYDADERVRGYREALSDEGGSPDRLLEFSGDFTEASGYVAAKRILEVTPRPTAIFASNDAMAIGALRVLREADFRVPQDMAVAGFDDVPVSRYVSPSLSTVHVPLSELGAQAAAMLLRAIEEGNAHEPEQRVLPVRLAVRESCGGHLDVSERTSQARGR